MSHKCVPPETGAPSFECPACGGTLFGRDTAEARGKVVVLDTVRCNSPRCGWRGNWPPKPGRPPQSGEAATGWIQLRVTLLRKNAYVRAAKPGKLTPWIFQVLDEAAKFRSPPKN